MGLASRKSFYMIRQQGNLLLFLRHAAQSRFYFLQNAVYIIILYFFVKTLFMFYIMDALKFKGPTLLVKGLYNNLSILILFHVSLGLHFCARMLLTHFSLTNVI